MTFTWESDVTSEGEEMFLNSNFSPTGDVNFHTPLCLSTSVPGHQNLTPRETDGQSYSQGSEKVHV